jgi:hypothetical protein
LFPGLETDCDLVKLVDDDAEWTVSTRLSERFEAPSGITLSNCDVTFGSSGGNPFNQCRKAAGVEIDRVHPDRNTVSGYPPFYRSGKTRFADATRAVDPAATSLRPSATPLELR